MSHDDHTHDRDLRAESKEYGRRQLVCSLVRVGLDLVFAVLLAVCARPLDEWLRAVGITGYWLRLAAFFAVMGMLHALVSFPVSLYAGYVLEHRYGLSRQSLGRWLQRHLLQLALTALLGIALVLGLFALIYATGPSWWLAAAAGTFLVSVLLGQLAPVLILPLFYKVERLEDDAMLTRFRSLAEGTSLRIEGVFRIRLSSETVKANAALAGLGRTRRVLLGDTLLDQFSLDEITVVLAHEIGHHVHHHISKMLIASVFYNVAAFWICDQVLRQVAVVDGALTYTPLPVFALGWILLVLTLLTTLLGPLQNAISRRYERQCDRYALQRTGLNDAYRSAFQKLADINKADPDPHPLEVIWFHDHPPIRERLAMAAD